MICREGSLGDEAPRALGGARTLARVISARVGRSSLPAHGDKMNDEWTMRTRMDNAQWTHLVALSTLRQFGRMMG